MKKHIAKLTALIFLSLPMAGCAQADAKKAAQSEVVPALTPKATISLEYPNPWDINNQIALSNDGSRLIDATHGARYIRVWDWQNNKVVQQLLLNEKAPEGNDNKSHDFVLGTLPGQELALSPDGRMVAACASTGKGQIRVWNLESGAIVADIPYPQRHVPGLDKEYMFHLGCNSISFSPDGKYMAVLNEIGKLYANEADFDEFQAISKINIESIQSSMKTGKAIPPSIQPKKPEVPITGIAVYETNTWKLERLFYRPAYRQPTFKSRPLFDADSKTVSAVLFDHIPGDWDKWAGNRIVRWDIATGAQLEERGMPQLVESASKGLWWTPLPGGREVWWRTSAGSDQTDAEAEQCKQRLPSSPAFVSDEKNNCAYEWSLAILNLDTGKIRYLAPFKKNVPPQVADKGGKQVGSISPDGAHIVLVRGNGEQRISIVEILDRETLRPEGLYSLDGAAYFNLTFSGNSKYLPIKFNKKSSTSNQLDISAMIFELPKKQ